MWGLLRVGLGCIYIMHLGVCLGLRNPKKKKQKTAEKQNSGEEEKQRSRKAKKQRSRERKKSRKATSREAEQWRSREAKKHKSRSRETEIQKNSPKREKQIPPKNSPPFQINIVAGRNSCSLIHTGKIVGFEF